MRGFILFFALLSSLYATRASAAPRVFVVPFELTDRHPAEPIMNRLRASLAESLAAAGLEVAAPFAESAGDSCTSAACLARAASLSGADRIVTARLSALGTSDWRFHLEMLDGNAQKIGQVDEDCEVCTIEEANDALTRAGQALAAGGPSTTEHLEAKLDLPRSPQTDAWAPPATDRLGRALRIGGPILLGVGLSGLAFGFVELALDHRRACAIPTGDLDCPRRVDTAAGQELGFIGGALAAGAGTALSAIGFHRLKHGLSVHAAAGAHSATIQLALHLN